MILTKQIDNFTIIHTEGKTIVHYRKTLHDWFHALIATAIGSFMWTLVYFSIVSGFKIREYTDFIWVAFFILTAVWFSVSALSKIIQPTKNVLIIDKNKNTLFSRRSFFCSKTFSLDDIQNLMVAGHKERVSVGDGKRMTVTYCKITAKIKEKKKEEELLIINTHRILRIADWKLEPELYERAKKIARELDKHLKGKYQEKGYLHNGPERF